MAYERRRAGIIGVVAVKSAAAVDHRVDGSDTPRLRRYLIQHGYDRLLVRDGHVYRAETAPAHELRHAVRRQLAKLVGIIRYFFVYLGRKAVPEARAHKSVFHQSSPLWRMNTSVPYLAASISQSTAAVTASITGQMRRTIAGSCLPGTDSTVSSLFI